MAEEDQRRVPVHARARAGQHIGQVLDQAVVRGQTAAQPPRFTVPVLVVPAHGKTPFVEPARHVLVAPGMFAQAVHQHHHTAQRTAFFQRPVLDGQVVAIDGNVGGECRLFQVPGFQGLVETVAICAITCATAAVSRRA